MGLVLLCVSAFVAAEGASAGTPALAGTRRAEDEDLVVTARLRREPSSQVPLSLTGVSGAELEKAGARDLAELARLVPNFAVPGTGVLGARQPSIRGIYSAAGGATVGLYLDDVPVQLRPLLFGASPNLTVFDLDRVEVLRGPQGTLFGASSLGGTVRLFSQAPNPVQAEGGALAELRQTEGGGHGRRLSLAGGGPLVAEALAFRLGAYHRRDGGVVDRVDPATGHVTEQNVDDVEVLALRGALSARMTPDIQLTPAFHYERTVNRDAPYFESDSGLDRQAFLFPQRGRDAFGLASLRVEARLGAIDLTSISAYYRREDERVSDYSRVFGELILGGAIPGLLVPGGSRSFTRIAQRNVSQEIRLGSGEPTAPVTWVLGGFYRRSRIALRQEVAEPGLDPLVGSVLGAPLADVFGLPLLEGGISYRGLEDVVETELAGFGELSWRLNERIEGFAGLRLASARLDLQVGSAGPYAGSGENRAAERRTEHPVTPRIGVSFRPNADWLAYLSASRGFRTGGANTPVPATACVSDLGALGRASAPTSYGSDTVWNYEAGVKASSPGGALRLQAALFQIDWTGIQQLVSLPNCGFSYVDNLGRARNRGFEVEAEVRPVEGLRLDGRLGYVDARFRQTVRSGAGEGAALLVARGDRVPHIPRLSFSASAEYRWAVGTLDAQAFIRSDLQYQGRYRRTPAAPATSFDERIFEGDEFADLRLRLGVERKPWSAALFATNLLDDRSILFSNAELVPATGSPLRQTALRPRTFGVTVGTQF